MLKQWWLKWREPKPFNEGYLPEADGHRIYFAEYGKKGGKPVLLTHGGPGAAAANRCRRESWKTTPWKIPCGT